MKILLENKSYNEDGFEEHERAIEKIIMKNSENVIFKIKKESQKKLFDTIDEYCKKLEDLNQYVIKEIVSPLLQKVPGIKKDLLP